MTRILMLTCQYQPDVFGGAEKQCQRIATELADRGHEVTVLTSTQKWIARGTRIENRVKVVRQFTPFPPDLLGRWLPFSVHWFLCVMLFAWRNRRQFDIVHAHQGKFGAFVATCFGKLTSLPVLIKIGNSEQDLDLLCLQRKAVVGSAMVKYILKARPIFVAISQVIQKNLLDFGCHDVVWIPNGISTRHTGTDGPSFAANSVISGPKLFYHGRLEPIKRPEVLLEAFSQVLKIHPSASLHLVGDGTSLASARRVADVLGIGSKVLFHGQVADAQQFVQRFDIFVNASRAEGFSNSLLEALVLGKVMVSTPVSGAIEAIVDGKNGYVASGFEANCLFNAINQAIALHQSNTDVPRQTSHALLEQRFAMPLVVRQYEQLYRQMLRGAD